MKNTKILALIILFVISRLLFINPDPVFFDSQEYINRLSDSNFFQALYSGHLPLHLGYILSLWPFFQMAKVLNLNPVISVILIQITLSLLSIIAFYKSIIILFNKKIALLSSIILSIIPIFWVSVNTIMIENIYTSFFIISFFFLLKYLRYRKNIFLIITLASFSISFLTHFVVVLWIPILIYITYFLKKKKTKEIVLAFAILLSILTIINGYFISINQNTDVLNGSILLYTGKLREHMSLSLNNIDGIFVYLRNLFIPILRNNTNLIIMLSLAGMLKIFKANKSLFLLFIFWLIPILITTQWWDSLLFGRHAMISTFAFVTLTSIYLERKKYVIIITLVYLLISCFPAVLSLKNNIPYIEVAKEIKHLPIDGLVIESHFARPQIQNQYEGKIIFVNEPGWNKDELDRKINNALKTKKQVFITSQALSEPYGLYSGPYLHTLSLSYKKEYILKDIIQNFTLKEHKILNREDNLIIYEIISSTPSDYPKIRILKYSKRRIDFYDPLSHIWFLISKNFDLKTN